MRADHMHDPAFVQRHQYRWVAGPTHASEQVDHELVLLHPLMPVLDGDEHRGTCVGLGELIVVEVALRARASVSDVLGRETRIRSRKARTEPISATAGRQASISTSRVGDTRRQLRTREQGRTEDAALLNGAGAAGADGSRARLSSEKCRISRFLRRQRRRPGFPPSVDSEARRPALRRRAVLGEAGSWRAPWPPRRLNRASRVRTAPFQSDHPVRVDYAGLVH
jgi:hypothetical protein